MSALELARRAKQELFEENKKKEHIKNLQQKQDRLYRQKLEDILDRTFNEFNGIAGIKLTENNGIRYLKKDSGEIIITAEVKWITYQNPNVDYKDEITELSIEWETSRQRGSSDKEEDFVISIANIMCKHI